jgi:protein-disulfide isomerase
VKFVFREVYFDQVGLWGAMVARCAPQDRYFGIIDLLLKKQADWSRGEDAATVVGNIKRYARQAGLDDTAIDTCMKDQAMAEKMVATFQTLTAQDQIDSTPSFVINGEKKGNMTYAEFAATLDKIAGN